VTPGLRNAIPPAHGRGYPAQSKTALEAVKGGGAPELTQGVSGIRAADAGVPLTAYNVRPGSDTRNVSPHSRTAALDTRPLVKPSDALRQRRGRLTE